MLLIWPSVATSYVLAGNPSDFPSEWNSSMPSKLKSIYPYVSHSISPSIILSLNTSKVPSLMISESGSIITSNSVEPSMYFSSSPYDIPLLSNGYCNVLRGDIGASPKIVLVWPVKGYPLPGYAFVHNFTCKNHSNPIPHNGVVDCTDKNYRYTYSSGEAFYYHRKPI